MSENLVMAAEQAKQLAAERAAYAAKVKAANAAKAKAAAAAASGFSFNSALVKKYWPYALGGATVLFFVLRK